MMVVAAAACSAAGAEPAGPAEPGPPAAPGTMLGPRPAGWKQLPAIAAAVGAAATADGVTIDAVDAWGEPARGCYAVWLDLHGGAAAAPVLAGDALDSLRRAGAPALGAKPAPRAGSATERPGSPAIVPSPGTLELDEIAAPTGPTGVLAFRFARPPYRGRVRAQLGNGRIAAIACFGNQREPVACDAACATVVPTAAVPGAAP